MPHRLLLLLILCLAWRASAQVASEPEWPDPAPALVKLLNSAALTPDEKRALRVRHGLASAEDLVSGSDRSATALISGRFDDPALTGTDGDLLDRADAALIVRSPKDAIAMLGDARGMRAARIRAEAQLELGDRASAMATIDGALAEFASIAAPSADDILESVRLRAMSYRIPGREPSDAESAQQGLIDSLATARQVDPLNWRVTLEEARILLERDSTDDAISALNEAVALAPRASQVWLMLGTLSARSMNSEKALEAANRLDTLAGGRSLSGSMVRARLGLALSDAATTANEMQSWSTVFPASREVLTLQASAAACQYDMDGFEKFAAQFDDIRPGSAQLLIDSGRSLSLARQYADAKRVLERAVERAPSTPEPLTELGLLLVQMGEDTRAGEILMRAVALDPFDIRASNSAQLVEMLTSFARVESDHFVVRYAPGMDEILAREMPETLERIYARVTSDSLGGIDFQVPAKTVIDLMPDHAAFSVRITGMPRVHTMAAATGPVIAMEAPRSGEGQSVGAYDWPRVVQHEFTHTVTLARTKNRLPHWFTEAAAVFNEDAPRDESRWKLLAGAHRNDELFDLDQINIAFTRPAKATDRSLAYAQGHWMYEFIVERFGARAPIELMDAYASGTREAEAMARILQRTREEFLAEFKAWAGAQLVSVGMALGEGGSSVPDLLARYKTDADPLPEPTVERVDELLASNPEHPDLLSLACAFALDANKGAPTDAMIPLFERLAKARPVDHTPHRMLARLYMETGRSALAVPHLQFLDAREQTTPVYAATLAKLLLAAGDREGAGRSALRAVAMSPYDARMRELAATVALELGDTATAERHLLALIALEPDREIHRRRLEKVAGDRR